MCDTLETQMCWPRPRVVVVCSVDTRIRVTRVCFPCLLYAVHTVQEKHSTISIEEIVYDSECAVSYVVAASGRRSLFGPLRSTKGALRSLCDPARTPWDCYFTE